MEVENTVGGYWAGSWFTRPPVQGTSFYAPDTTRNPFSSGHCRPPDVCVQPQGESHFQVSRGCPGAVPVRPLFPGLSRSETGWSPQTLPAPENPARLPPHPAPIQAVTERRSAPDRCSRKSAPPPALTAQSLARALPPRSALVAYPQRLSPPRPGNPLPPGLFSRSPCADAVRPGRVVPEPRG